MLNKERHGLIMGQILKDIYTDASIAPLLGFKGGTCAYLFYGLPRFSVDLDFDLLSTDETLYKAILEKISDILKNYGILKDARIKRYTIFALLSYGDDDHNIKVEINTRMLIANIKDHYELKKYLGLSMLAATQDYVFATKLSALTSRKEIVMRDVYDVYYFAKNRWDINYEVLTAATGKNIKAHLADCIAIVETIKDNQILQGIGELLDEKEKVWAKKNLKSEVIFLLKNYLSVIK